MSFIVGILTVVMVLNCAVLILLILIQLPKKDAGAGLAFGGGAADALFGAGSGNALTKITKWAAGIFFALALLMGYMEDRLHTKDSSGFENLVRQTQSQQQSAVTLPPPAAPPAAAPTNSLLTVPLTAGTNTAAAPTQSK
jgi:preprotein translocase subunit SecG